MNLQGSDFWNGLAISAAILRNFSPLPGLKDFIYMKKKFSSELFSLDKYHKLKEKAGIALLSLTSKVFRNITAAVGDILCQEQAGFRKEKSCIGHIFALRQLLEQSREWNRTLYAVFVDFVKAFETGSHHSVPLWEL